MSTAMSKTDLIKKVEQLTDELRELRELKKVITPEQASLPESGIGIVKDDGVWKMVKLEFNIKTRSAKVGEIIGFNNDVAMVLYHTNKEVSDRYLKLLRTR